MRWSLVTFALCSSAWAEAPPNIAPVPSALDDVQQARNYAMGGAYHSMGLGTEAIEGNPATMSLFKRYQVELGGAWDIPNGMGFGGLSVMDSASSDLAMGVSYQLLTFNSPYGRSTAHLTTLAVAYPITDWLHIGVSGRNQILDGPYSTNSITASAGIALRIYDLVVLGFTAANLIPVNSPLVNRYFALSLAGNFGLFSPSVEVKGDFNAPFPRFSYAGGLEYIIGEVIPVRGGYAWDNISNAKYISIGSGFFSSGSGVDIAYRHEIGGANGKLIALTIKLQGGGQ